MQWQHKTHIKWQFLSTAYSANGVIRQRVTQFPNTWPGEGICISCSYWKERRTHTHTEGHPSTSLHYFIHMSLQSNAFMSPPLASSPLHLLYLSLLPAIDKKFNPFHCYSSLNLPHIRVVASLPVSGLTLGLFYVLNTGCFPCMGVKGMCVFGFYYF